MRQLSIQRSLQLSSMDKAEGQKHHRPVVSEILPETAKFNPVPVQLLDEKQIQMKHSLAQAGHLILKKHHKNQMSFGKRASSQNTTKAINFQQDQQLPIEKKKLEIPQEYSQNDESEDEEIIIQKGNSSKQDSIVSVKNEGSFEKSSPSRSRFSPPYQQIQSPQKRSPFLNQQNLTRTASSSTTQKLNSKQYIPKPKEEAKQKKQREFLVRNVNEHRKMIYEVNQQRSNDSQIRSEVVSSDQNPCYSVEQIKKRRSLKSIKSQFVHGDDQLFYDNNFKGKLRQISRPQSHIIGNYLVKQENSTDKRSHFQEFMHSEKGAKQTRSKFRHSKSSDKLRNVQSRGSISRVSMKKQQSMTDLQKRNQSLYPASSNPSLRPSTKQSQKEKKLIKSPYQAHWNQRVLEELFNVSYSGNRPVNHRSQKSLKQKQKSPGLSMKHHSIVNPFSGAVFPRQSFSIAHAGQPLESVPSISDLSSRRHYADQSGISLQRELTPPIIHSTNMHHRQRDVIFTHQGGFKRPGSKTSFARHNSGQILQQKIEKIKKVQKRQKQKFLINALTRRPIRQNLVNSPDPLHIKRTTPVKIPQSSASVANLKQGMKSHFGLNNPQRLNQNESQQSLRMTGTGAGGQERGGDNYIHNHINININHNYRGGHNGKKRED